MRISIYIKRFLAIILDFISFLGIWGIFLVIFSYGVVSNNNTYNLNADIIEEVLLSTGLYDIEDGNIVAVSNNINDKLVLFYTDNPYLDTYDNKDNYEQAKISSGLFSYSQSVGYYVEKDNVDSDELSYFYSREFKKVEVSLYNSNIEYRNALDYNQNFMTIGSYITIVLSSLVVYFVIPLILKNGQTIFYKVFKLKIVSQDEKDLSFWQLFIRFWTNSFVILLAWNFYFISFIVVFLVFIIDKQHRTIGDFSSVSMCKELIYEEKRR